MSKVTIRQAGVEDADAIGELHAASWKSAYRGLLSDSYLNNDLVGERLTYWRGKMPKLSSNEFVLVAERGHEVAGFISVLDIPENGYAALVDNLHVTPELKGGGIGGLMMRAAARKLLEDGRSNYYLWVLVGNIPAEKFYVAKHGRPLDMKESDFGGTRVWATRFVWDNFDQLLSD